MRRRLPEIVQDGTAGLVLLFLAAAVLLSVRAWWEPAVPPGMPVEVMGQVARPGLYLVDPPTLVAAVEAAGGSASGVADEPLQLGDAVVVEPEGPRRVRMEDGRLVGRWERPRPQREGWGARAAELVPLVSGVGLPAPPEEGAVRPESPEPGASPARRPAVQVDLNTASAAELERLPGIGPALAARIVADREERGPFDEVRALDRVSGIGPATIQRLGEQAVVR